MSRKSPPSSKSTHPNQPSADTLAGLATIGRYEILRKIGQGGTAAVLLGRDPFIDRLVAIKIAQPASDQARRKFFVEAQSAGRLNHPNIVSIYDAGILEDYCYITMEYINGISLETHCQPEHMMQPRQAVETVFHVCKALAYAHQQKVIHRDIKPSNILIDANGVPKIADFGVAHITETTSELGIWGTPSYMAPEQIKDEVLDGTCDIFSVGCVLYELLTGQQAFPGENNFAIMYKITNSDPTPVRRIYSDLPVIIEEILDRALAKQVPDRYPSCNNMAYDLQVALRGIVDPTHNQKARNIVELVQVMPFFRSFSPGQLNDLIAESTIFKAHIGQTIVDEGDIDDTFFVILSGQAIIKKNGAQIARIGIGECFGEMAYIAGQPRSATVIAATECLLMKFNATAIDQASDAIQLQFYKNFANTLVRRLAHTTSA